MVAALALLGGAPGASAGVSVPVLSSEVQADLSELRVGADPRNVWFLARTTTMTAPVGTALLVLVDAAPGTRRVEVPFNSGIHTMRADYALLLTAGGGWIANLATGSVSA